MNPWAAGFSGPFKPAGTSTEIAVHTRMLKALVRMTSEASRTSFDSIFLPRYSGVRPTIRPAMKTARTAKTSIPYRPAPTPPGVTSPSWMRTSGTMPPIGVKLSWLESTEPVLVPVVVAANWAE